MRSTTLMLSLRVERWFVFTTETIGFCFWNPQGGINRELAAAKKVALLLIWIFGLKFIPHLFLDVHWQFWQISNIWYREKKAFSRRIADLLMCLALRLLLQPSWVRFPSTRKTRKIATRRSFNMLDTWHDEFLNQVSHISHEHVSFWMSGYNSSYSCGWE